MFVQNLNRKQQGVMLSLVNKLIGIDGDIAKEELAMIATLEAQCHKDSKINDIPMSALKGVFNTEREKTSLMLELLAIAYADDEYHESEQDFLKEITQKIDLDDSKLADMENWVKRQLILANQAESFMEE